MILMLHYYLNILYSQGLLVLSVIIYILKMIFYILKITLLKFGKKLKIYLRINWTDRVKFFLVLDGKCEKISKKETVFIAISICWIFDEISNLSFVPNMAIAAYNTLQYTV